MCGIFGFITSEGEGPEIGRLRRLALITQTRGEHAFGLACLGADGTTFEIFKRPGPAHRYLDELERCRRAVVVIGHCRYATHGSPLDNRNNHPHVAGGGFLAHNGVIYNHQDLARRFRLRPQTECDSEILGLLMARCPGTIAQRAAWTTNQARGPLAMLGLWRRPARLLVVRRGKPLHLGQGRDGFYFASLPDGLPGRVRAVTEDSARVLAHENGALRLADGPIDLAADGHLGSGLFNHPNTL